MYESPIRLLVQQLETNIREQQEKQIFEAVQKCGVDVNREELIKALAYDRAQYAQGYSDGRADAMPRWINLKERLPKHGEIVLCYTKYFYEVLQWDDDAEQWVGQYSVNAKHYVTHWMPRPEPPKEE